MSMCINSVQFTSKETWKVLCGTHFKSRDYKLFFAENQCRTIYNTRSVYGLHFFIKCRYVRDVCEKIEPRRTCVREKQISQNNVYQESRRDFEIYIKVDKTDKSKIFLQHTCTCNTIHQRESGLPRNCDTLRARVCVSYELMRSRAYRSIYTLAWGRASEKKRARGEWIYIHTDITIH